MRKFMGKMSKLNLIIYFKFIFLNETDNIKFVDRYCGREKIVERGGRSLQEKY
jgi:hypothetical protein